jgi:hypothetical protein
LTCLENIIEVFNQHLKKSFDATTGVAVVKQNAVIDDLIKAGYERRQLFDDHLLDIEPTFRAAGWTVDYNKPAYDQTFDAYWEFSISRSLKRIATPKKFVNV